MMNVMIDESWEKVLISYLNLAVSGSISSSSLTGERGTLAENFSASGEKEGNEVRNVASQTSSDIQFFNMSTQLTTILTPVRPPQQLQLRGEKNTDTNK